MKSRFRAGSTHGAERRDRRRTAATQRREERALRGGRCPSHRIVERGDQRAGGAVGGAALDRERTLSGRREHDVEGQVLGDRVLQPEPLHARRGDDDGVVLPGQRTAHTGVDVAAQRRDAEVGPSGAQLGDASRAGGGDGRAARQGRQRATGAGDQHVARIGAVAHRCDHEVVGDLDRQVLEGMHREVDGALAQSGLEGLGEDALAADFRERAVQHTVTFGGDRDCFAARPDRLAQRLHHPRGLPARQPGLPGAAAQRGGCRGGRHAAPMPEPCGPPSRPNRRRVMSL